MGHIQPSIAPLKTATESVGEAYLHWDSVSQSHGKKKERKKEKITDKNGKRTNNNNNKQQQKKLDVTYSYCL